MTARAPAQVPARAPARTPACTLVRVSARAPARVLARVPALLLFESVHLVPLFLRLSLLALVLPALSLPVSFFSDLPLCIQTLTSRDE